MITEKKPDPPTSVRERVLAPDAVIGTMKSSGVKLLLTGAPRLGDLLFAFPAINYLLRCGMVEELSVLCHRYAAPLLDAFGGKVGQVTLPDYSWNIFNRWRTSRRIKQDHFDAALVLNGKKSMRKLLAATHIPTILIEQPKGMQKPAQHLRTVIKAFPQAGTVTEPVAAIPMLQVPRQAIAWAQGMLDGIEHPVIAFHVGCQRIARKNISFEQVNRTTIKLWLVERYLELGRMLIDQLGASVLMVGSGKHEHLLADEFVKRLGPRCKSAVDWGDCMQTAALLKHCHALVASDSGVLHLGAAVGLKTVAVWGPTPVEIYAPMAAPDLIRIVNKRVYCSPCRKRECDNKICLSSISAREVFEALMALDIDQCGNLPVASV